MISLSDYPSKVSLLIPVYGCQYSCPYCFNPEYLEHKELDIDKTIQDIQLNLEFIDAIIFTGGDPSFQLEKVIEVAIYAQSVGLKIGFYTQNPSLGIGERIKNSNVFDYVVYTVNYMQPNTLKSLKSLYNDTKMQVEFKSIYGGDELCYVEDVDVVQQLQTGECLSSDYNLLKPPTHSEVKEFAQMVNAKYIITKQNGREKIA